MTSNSRRLTTAEQHQVRQLYEADPRRYNAKHLAKKFNVGRRQIDDLVQPAGRPARNTNINRPEGKRGLRPFVHTPRPDPRDKTGIFFSDPLPHHLAARASRETEKETEE